MMKLILLLVCTGVIFACSTSKSPVVKSVENKKKEAFKKTKPVTKSLPNSSIPNATESTNPESPTNKPNDAREF